MASFTPEFLDEIRRRTSLADVVGRSVRLKERARGDFWGLSPFTKEKTPSFHVMEDKGFYKCFSTEKSGDAFTFLMDVEGMSFPEAVEKLAGEAGLELPRDTPEERQRYEKRKSLTDVNELACTFFEKMLRRPEGKAGLDYLRRRGLNDDMIRKWRLGFAPDGRGHLKAALGRENVPDELMIEAGLLRVPDNGTPYDWFRGRVIFPIRDRRGHVIAFGGRIIGDGEPKYLNSPETPVFKKRYALYGMGEAASNARKAGRMIVCEGYMDVIGLDRAGIGHAVAPLGTALTEDHLRDIWKVVREPVLCFDGDEAGQRAAFRAAERALPAMQAGQSLRFAILPAGEDPDSLTGTDAEAMTQVIDQAVPLSDVLWISLEEGVPKNAEGQAELYQRILTAVRNVDDQIYRRALSDDFFGRLRVRRGDRRSSAVASRVTPVCDEHLTWRILLATLINHPSLLDKVEDLVGAAYIEEPRLNQARVDILSAGDVSLEHLEADMTTVYVHAPFAKPNANGADALNGWMALYESLQVKDMEAEIRAAAAAVAEDPTPEAMDRLRRLKKVAG